MKLLGIVLAGGRSSRFGSDKALAVYCGRTLLDRAIAVVAPLVAEVAISGRAHAGLRSIADRPAPGLGPLGGLNGALALAAAEDFDAILSVPCDVPLLDPETLRALLGSHRRAAILEGSPVCGYWPVLLAHQLDQRLQSGASRSVSRWAEDCDATIIPTPGLININAIDDLTKLP